MEDLVFIILRHVREAKHNLLYIECYNSIRKFYNNTIYIIDDNSNKNVLVEHDMSGVNIIHSDFPGSGEILPYYYLYHRKLGKKAVILHDSMFIQKPIPLESVNDYKFLWNFKCPIQIDDVEENFHNAVFKLEKRDELYDIFHDFNTWYGCFGASMVITLDFIYKLQENTQFLNILPDINTRKRRSMFERFIGIVCHYTLPKELEELSYMNSIFQQPNEWGTEYEEYLGIKDVFKDVMVVKVWSGR